MIADWLKKETRVFLDLVFWTMTCQKMWSSWMMNIEMVLHVVKLDVKQYSLCTQQEYGMIHYNFHPGPLRIWLSQPDNYYTSRGEPWPTDWAEKINTIHCITLYVEGFSKDQTLFYSFANPLITDSTVVSSHRQVKHNLFKLE
jgi:hypothetical protein